jgi:uncharacterized protein YjbJ (UPF0337 family)
MGFLDKLLGRGKRTLGEATDNPRLREEGRHEEAAGEAKDRAETHEELARDERERALREEEEKDRLS